MSHPALRLIPEKGCPTSNRYLLSKRVEVYGALDKKITEVVNVDTLVVYRLAYRNGLNIEPDVVVTFEGNGETCFVTDNESALQVWADLIATIAVDNETELGRAVHVGMVQELQLAWDSLQEENR